MKVLPLTAPKNFFSASSTEVLDLMLLKIRELEAANVSLNKTLATLLEDVEELTDRVETLENL